MTEFDAFIAAAWNEHAEYPQAVAERLAASLHRVQDATQVPPYARLVTHVLGEHLGDGASGIALLEALHERGAAAGSATAARAIACDIAALRHASGVSLDASRLGPEDRICALATAASILAGRDDVAAALDAYAQALRLADAGVPAGSPALRALAVGGNNLAATLEEKTDRDARTTAAMVEAARGGLKYWKLAGTWLEEERAEYRLARSLMQAGDAAAATASARRCVEICARHQAPPFERFFAQAVLALAQRAAGDTGAFEASRASALQWLEQVSKDERPSCDSDLAELGV